MSSNSWYMAPLPQSLKAPPAYGLPEDEVIYGLFGRGLSAAEWRKQLESLHYTWKPIWRQELARKELRYFKLEIEELLSRPNTNIGPGPKSNSCKSVLLQIQGHTGEREKRLRDGRLCGPEATSRTLENRVNEWKHENLMLNTRLQPSNNVLLSVNDATIPGVPDYHQMSGSSSSSHGFPNVNMSSMDHPFSYLSFTSPLNTDSIPNNRGIDSNIPTSCHIHDTPRIAQFNNFVPLEYDGPATTSSASFDSDETPNYTFSQQQAAMRTRLPSAPSVTAEGHFDLHPETCCCEECSPSSSS